MLKRIFWNGIKVVLPLAVTIAVIYWVFIAIEHFFGYIILLIVGPRYYFQGLGFIVGIILVLIVGILMSAWLGRKLHEWWIALIKRIPGVSWLYNAFSDLIGFFESRKESPPGKHVVMVQFEHFRALGLITREDFKDLVAGLGNPGEVSVFIPFAYQIGGFMINVSKEYLTPLEMTVEHAMRYAITAGMITRK